MSADKSSALQSIVALMQTYELTLSDVKAAYKNDKKAQKILSGDRVLNLFLYIGGALVLSGLGIFISILWHDLSSVARVFVTLIPGLLAFAMGLFYQRSEKLEQISPLFFLISFVLIPTGLMVFLKEFIDGDNRLLGGVLVFGICSVQFALALSKCKSSTLYFCVLTYLLGLLSCASQYLEIDRGYAACAVGIGYLVLTLHFYRKNIYKEVSLFFLVVGSLLFFGGAVDITLYSYFAPLAFTLALGFIIFSRLVSRTVLYTLGILFMLISIYAGLSFVQEGLPIDISSGFALTTFGCSLFLTSLWLRKSNDNISFLWFLLSAGLVYSGIISIIFDTPIEILFLLFSLMGAYLALVIKNRTILAVSIINFIGYISYFSEKHFADIISWPVLLIALGFLLIGAGRIYIKLSQKLVKS